MKISLFINKMKLKSLYFHYSFIKLLSLKLQGH